MPHLRRRQGPIAGTRVWLASAALDDMLDEAAEHAPLETGGVLLGYVSPRGDPGDPEQVMVEAALGPGPAARHSKSRFDPDSGWQERELARRYQESGRITTYLGDWHTHPNGVPVPSRRDEKTAQAISRDKNARLPRPLMLILASQSADVATSANAEASTEAKTRAVEPVWTFVVHRWDDRRLRTVDSEVLVR